jgi:uncharacterized damage-inducible protein DinB
LTHAAAAATETNVPGTNDRALLEVILDSWDRNNRILVNLLRALPPGGLQAQAIPGSPSVAQMFGHMHYVRLVFLSEDAPQFNPQVPSTEWSSESTPDTIAADLDRSAKAVRNAVESLVLSGEQMKIHYDHPLLFMQHMIWHEGYHHGQIKLALKISGEPFDDEEIGPLTWDLLLEKTSSSAKL